MEPPVEDAVIRFFEHLVQRVSGPMKFRLLIQPAMAIFFAVKAGLLDARLGRPPYGWALLTDSTHRSELIKDGRKDILKVFVIALVLDAIYQWIVGRFIYPGEMLVVAFMLATLPYVLVRGMVGRLKRRADAPPPSNPSN